MATHYASLGHSPGVSLGQQWVQTVTDIDTLVEQHQYGQIDKHYAGITRDHWKPNYERSHCANPTCSKEFGWTERYHHCRKCGDLFCNACTQYYRRLNNLAHPDPNGKLHKVCEKCFDKGPQTIGQTRNLMPYIQIYKSHHLEQLALDDRNTSRRKLDVNSECERLKNGFYNAIRGSALKRHLSDLKSMVSEPQWQKSHLQIYEAMCGHCRSCRKEFGVVRSKNHCRVCGLAVCGKCSTKDLIVYVPDECNSTTDPEVQLAIIKIVGCPDKEPDICLYLRVCESCSSVIQKKQVNKHQKSLICENETVDIMAVIVEIHEKVKKVQQKIDRHLPQYQELIDAMEIKPGAARSLPNTRSNIQILAKSQGDLADHFTQLVMTLNELKNHKPATKAQATIVKNLIKSCCEYYHENMYQFRELRKRLAAVTPSEVLECIQQIVDKNAINSLYLSVKQLALEALHLCTKYDLGYELPRKLGSLEEVAQKELHSSLLKCGENLEEHEDCVNQLLQELIKEHRLVRPSKRLTKQFGAQHIRAILLERSDLLLRQIQLQLNAKCADRSFKTTKDQIEDVQKSIKEMVLERKVENDWVWVT